MSINNIDKAIDKVISRLLCFTPRERDVIVGVLKGASNSTIGQMLKIEVKTVEGHLTTIYGIYQVSGRTQLVIKLMREMPILAHLLTNLNNNEG